MGSWLQQAGEMASTASSKLKAMSDAASVELALREELDRKEFALAAAEADMQRLRQQLERSKRKKTSVIVSPVNSPGCAASTAPTAALLEQCGSLKHGLSEKNEQLEGLARELTQSREKGAALEAQCTKCTGQLQRLLELKVSVKQSLKPPKQRLLFEPSRRQRNSRLPTKKKGRGTALLSVCWRHRRTRGRWRN